MDTFVEMLRSRVENLLGRTAGPLNFRLVVMPLVVTFFALRAAMRDARAGRPLYFRTLLLKPAERPRLIRSGLKDVGKIILMAVVLDTTYQILVFKVFHLEELLVVVMVSAILPYFVVRSAGSILMRRVYREHPKATGQSPPNPKEEPSDRPAPPSNTGL